MFFKYSREYKIRRKAIFDIELITYQKRKSSFVFIMFLTYDLQIVKYQKNMISRFIAYIARRMRAFRKHNKNSPQLSCAMNTCKMRQVTSPPLLSAPKWLTLLINHAIKVISQHFRIYSSGTL